MGGRGGQELVPVADERATVAQGRVPGPGVATDLDDDHRDLCIGALVQGRQERVRAPGLLDEDDGRVGCPTAGDMGKEVLASDVDLLTRTQNVTDIESEAGCHDRDVPERPPTLTEDRDSVPPEFATGVRSHWP